MSSQSQREKIHHFHMQKLDINSSLWFIDALIYSTSSLHSISRRNERNLKQNKAKRNKERIKSTNVIQSKTKEMNWCWCYYTRDGTHSNNFASHHIPSHVLWMCQITHERILLIWGWWYHGIFYWTNWTNTWELIIITQGKYERKMKQRNKERRGKRRGGKQTNHIQSS